MSRFSTFLFGAIVGALTMYVGLKYHVLRTDDGVQFVPKLTANFEDVYLDVRKFTPADWAEHKGVSAALVHAGKEDILKDSATDALRSKVDGMLDGLGLSNETKQR